MAWAARCGSAVRSGWKLELIKLLEIGIVFDITASYMWMVALKSFIFRSWKS